MSLAGEFICLLDERIKPVRRYTMAGVIAALLVHLSFVGAIAYDYYEQLKRWETLFGLRVVNEPGSIRLLWPTDIARLRVPLYYPPGLVKSGALSDEERKRQEEERHRREAERQARKSLEQAAKESESQTEPPAVIPQTWDELEQTAREQAKKLNIGPIRDAIVQIYRAKQQGTLVINEVTVAASFRVEKDGTLTSVQLTEPSGIPQIDAAAMMILDEANRTRVLAPLSVAESVTVKFVIAEATELRFIAVSPSEAGAATLLSQLNALLLLARLNSSRLDPQAASLISRLMIQQEGRNVVARVTIPRAEASEMFRSRIGT